jgi:hypothetical protein
MSSMSNARRVPDADQLRAYLDRGLTHAEIADAWFNDSGTRVSRSTVSMAVARFNLKDHSPRAHMRHSDLIPWKLEGEHVYKPEARLLRLEGRRRAGHMLREDETRWLENWKQELSEAGAVIHYDPDTEEGFFWVTRADSRVVTEGDDDLIDRSNAEPAPETTKSRGSRMAAPRDKRRD